MGEEPRGGGARGRRRARFAARSGGVGMALVEALRKRFGGGGREGDVVDGGLDVDRDSIESTRYEG